MFLNIDVVCVIYDKLAIKDGISLSLSSTQFQHQYCEWARLNWNHLKKVSMSHLLYSFNYVEEQQRAWLNSSLDKVKFSLVPIKLMDYLPIIASQLQESSISDETHSPATELCASILNQPDVGEKLVNIPSIKVKNWQTNLSDYSTRLNKVTYGALSQVTWDQVMVIGGIHNILLDSNLNIDDYPGSDLDLFVWGQTKEERVAKSQKVMEEIQAVYPHNTLFYSRGTVTTVIIRGLPRIFQIICTQHTSVMDIFNSFDSDMSGVGYNGSDIICHPHYLKGIVNNDTCTFSGNIIKVDRVVKMLLRGFAVHINEQSKIMGDRVYTAPELENLDEIIENDKTVNQALYKYLTITNEPISRITFLVRSIFGKNYCILNSISSYAGGADWNVDYIPYRGVTLDKFYPQISSSRTLSVGDNRMTYTPIDNIFSENALTRITLTNVNIIEANITRGSTKERLTLVIEVDTELLTWIKNLQKCIKTKKRKSGGSNFHYCSHKSKHCSQEGEGEWCAPDHYSIKIKTDYNGCMPPIYYKRTKFSSVTEVRSMFEPGFTRRATMVVVPAIFHDSFLIWRLVSMRLYNVFC